MNYILLTQKCNNELNDRYLKYITDTSSKISFVEYINELFNPSDRGIIYTKICDTPLKIKIWAPNLEMVLEEYIEKSSFKAIGVKNIELNRFNRILKYGEILDGEWSFDLITSNVESKADFTVVREKECYNEKKYAFEEYNKYWIDSDIITKRREEKSKADQKKSITEYNNIAVNFDKNTIIFKLKDSNYTFKENQRIRIATKVITDPTINNTIFVGNVLDYISDKKELIIESNDVKLLQHISQNKDYKKGSLFVDDIGTMIMLKRQKDALKNLFNRNTANKNLKDFIPNINLASTTKLDFLNKNLLSDDFNNKMNESQKRAVKNAIECKDINLIQGPPGTGKTTVICEIVNYLAKDNKSILISSQNNLAVDNVLQKVGENNGIRAIRVGKEERFELGCERYALTSRVEYLQEEILNNIENINNEYNNQNIYLKENLSKYNFYISGEEKIKKLLRLKENYISSKNNHDSLEEELIKLEKQMENINSSISVIKNVIDGNLENINCLSSIVNECNLDRNKILDYSNEILNLKITKEDIENLQLYYHIKTTIEGLVNEYREIDLQYENKKVDQENLKNEFETIKNKIVSLTIQKDKLDRSLDKYVNDKINSLKEELIAIKEDYRIIEFDIKYIENKKSEAYKKIYDLKQDVEMYKQNIELLFQSNSQLCINKKEFIDIVKSRNYIFTKCDEKNIDVSLISHIKELENIQKLYSDKKNIEDRIINISKEILKEKKYIKALEININKYVFENDVKVILQNENTTYENMENNILSSIQNYIKNYEMLDKNKKLLDKTDSLRTEWKENMYYYQKSFEDIYIGISNVICATCSGIASNDNNNFAEKEFDYVIIDEAAKCFSSEILIPMVKGKKIILVGDHKQLSPIVERDILEDMEKNNEISNEEMKNYYNNSLFGIMFEKADKLIKTTLDTQYRMNNDISQFISKQYYDSKLKDGGNIINLKHGVENLNRGIYWIDTLDCEKSKENIIGTSYYNKEESKVILDLLIWLDSKMINNKKEVGIISPYSAQKTYLIDLLSDYKFENIDIEINTVDAFQGREKQIIIMNCVRNNNKGEFGHVSGDSRMNVAISRAQELLFMIGNREFVERNKARSRSIYSLIKYLDKNNSIINKDFFL